ncbi:MAG: hypothetical protein K8U57_03545 [Planctomycetes bacterium]|nr:hypothetical protein [Planctomycetota bacterium]
MDSSSGRWYLLGTSTNKHGVTHFTVTRSNEDEADFDELVRVLVDRFGAVGDGELLGPYSIHRYVKVGGLRLGIILDEPEWLSLFATEPSQRDALASFVPKLLEAMNSPPRTPSSLIP